MTTYSPSNPLHKAEEPLHRQLTTQLRREISLLHPGDKIESQNQLAARLGASVLTVREALSSLAEQGVIERRPGSGTYVLDPARNQWVAVHIELDLTSQFTSFSFRQIARQALATLHSLGRKARLYCGTVDPSDPVNPTPQQLTTSDAFVEDLNAGRIRGVILMGGNSATLRSRLAELQIPVVDGSGLTRFGVTTENLSVTLAHALDHLVADNRRRIALMTWGDIRPMITACRTHGLDIRPEWARCDLPPARPGSGYSEFHEIWSARTEKPDGLIILDDVLFTDAIPAILQHHIDIPKELHIAVTLPRGLNLRVPFPVTRLQLDPASVGDESAKMLDQLMLNQPVPHEIISIPTQLLPWQQQSTPQLINS